MTQDDAAKMLTELERDYNETLEEVRLFFVEPAQWNWTGIRGDLDSLMGLVNGMSEDCRGALTSRWVNLSLRCRKLHGILHPTLPEPLNN